jgi:integrase/recombinase XerD
LRTLTARILRRDELRRDTPLVAVIESFFIHQSISPKTEEFYRTHFTSFVKYLTDSLGREPILDDVDPDYAAMFLKKLERTPTSKYPRGSPFRARAASVSLKRLANWLAKSGRDGKPLKASSNGDSVLIDLQKAKLPKDVRQPLSDEELDRVLAAAGRLGDRDYCAIIFLAGTGLRLNECREARVSDLNLKGRQFTVRAETSKFKAARTVDFHDDVARELDRYLYRTPQLVAPGDPLFPTDEGKTFQHSGFAKLFQRLGDRSGVGRFSAHLLRHTWATNFMLNGGDLLQLKRQGGWSEWEMVERYSHVVPIKDRTALPNPTKLKVRLRAAKVVAIRRLS